MSSVGTRRFSGDCSRFPGTRGATFPSVVDWSARSRCSQRRNCNSTCGASLPWTITGARIPAWFCPGEETARVSPLEMWDSMVELTGRIDVPQQPGLIYQFLPVRWGTIDHAGVEFKDMVYDSTILNDYRSVPSGYFRAADNKAPFFVDPQDLSRIWFHDPESDRVEPIEWRGAYRTDAPMTEAIV